MLNYRSLTAADDAVLASIIRTSLEQVHLNLPGTAYFDPELDHLSAYYEAKLSEKIGITSESLMSGAEGLRERYVNKRIGGIDFSGYFTEF
mgnify:CR=1 FL=1